MKVRAAHCKTNKAQTLYSANSYVCSIVANQVRASPIIVPLSNGNPELVKHAQKKIGYFGGEKSDLILLFRSNQMP